MNTPLRPARTAPVAPGLPLLGSTVDALLDPTTYFARCHQQLGSVFRVQYPGKELLMIAGLEANRRFAVDGAELFDIGATYARVTRDLGSPTYPNALEGRAHRDLRQALAPALTAAAVAPFLPRIEAAVTARARALVADRPHRVAAVAPLVADAVSVATCGVPLGDDLGRQVALYATMIGVVAVGGAFPEATLRLPPVTRARARFRAFTDARLAEHRASPPGPGRPPDVVDAVLALAAAREGGLDEDAVRALCLLPSKNAGIYLYRLVGFALWEILTRPDLKAAVQAEVDATDPHDVDALRDTPALQATLLECLRTHPMALALPRVVRAPFTLGGYTFEPGETVYLAGPATHLDPALFRDPERFDPARFGADRSEHRRPHAFAPFGLGAHACLARPYSLVMATAVLVSLLRAVDLAVEPAAYELKVRGWPHPIPEARFPLRFLAPRAAPLPRPRAVGRPTESLELDPATRDLLLSERIEATFPAGGVVFHQGDEARAFYMVQEGAVEVVTGGEGEGRVLARLGPGESFGEIGLLQGVPRTATVRVASDGPARVWVLPGEAFRRLVVEGDLTGASLARLVERRAALQALASALPGLDAPALAALGSGVGRRTAQPGEVVVRQGEVAQAAYVLVRGAVEVVHEGADADDIVLARLEGADVFGEIGVLEDRPRTATVRVVDGPAELVVLDKGALTGLVATSDAPSDLGRLVAGRLAERVRR